MTTLIAARGKSSVVPVVHTAGGMVTMSMVARTLPPGILPVVAVDRTSGKPLYKQLYEGYRDAIIDRRLSGGQRLPSTRSLAAELRISRIPVLGAFEQLLAEGYFESRPGAGTFVASSLPDVRLTTTRQPALENPAAAAGPGARTVARRPAEVFLNEEPGPWSAGLEAFQCCSPPADRFPTRVWSALVARHSRKFNSSQLHYHRDPMGLSTLREAVAQYLRTSRAVRCDAGQIMVVSGSQQALDIASRVLLDEASPVWIEEPGYWGARHALMMAGARLVAVPVDGEGLDVEAGIARCPRPRAVYVTPSHQLPLGVTMSATRRLKLLHWARRRGVWIIEDDYDGEYRYGNFPVASLQGLDRDSRVIYIGTFTKSVFPAIRLGYIVLPPDLVKSFVAVRRAMDMFSPPFIQSVLADFIEEGHFERHLRRTRLLCHQRRRALVAAVDEQLGPVLRVIGDEAGMFLTTVLEKGYRDRDVAGRAALRGVRAFPLSECYMGKARRQGLVLGYGGYSEKELVDGVARLRAVLDAG